jgi:hypothetical protein
MWVLMWVTAVDFRHYPLFSHKKGNLWPANGVLVASARPGIDGREFVIP